MVSLRVGHRMIRLTRLDNSDVLINPDLIEHVEVNTDTVVTLTTGRSLVVKENSEEIQKRIVEFKRRCSHILAANEMDS